MNAESKTEARDIRKAKDPDYWKSSVISRAYMRVIFALGTVIAAAFFLQAMNLPMVVQIIVSILLAAFVLFFRFLVPEGISGLMGGKMTDMGTKIQESMNELAEGDTEGVPGFLKNNMDYPTKEELEKTRTKFQKKKEALEAKRVPRKRGK